MLVRSKDQTQLLAGLRATPNSSTWSFPSAQFSALGFWLLPWPLTEIFPHFLGTKDLAVQWDFCQCLWAAYISQLAEAHPSPLTPSAARWLLHGGTGRVTWTSQIQWFGPWIVFFVPLPFSIVACLHRWVWRWTVRRILTWWRLLELVAFHSWQDFGCSVAV